MRDLTGIDCIGYCRVSTDRQAGEKQTSLTDQAAAILALAGKMSRTVRPDAWFRDDGYSGASVEHRPAFRDLLDSCEASPRKNRSGLVLVLNDSRFGRFPNPEEATYWRFHLDRLGWVVRFCEGDDVENPFARGVLRFVGSAQASEYRANIRANAKRGARGTAEQGFWTREAPYGYRRKVVFPLGPRYGRILQMREQKAANEKVSLYPHDAESVIVRRIFEAFASGEHTLGSLARCLMTEVADRVWCRRTVQAILKNETYLGDISGGRRKNLGHGQFVSTEASEWYGKRDAHPALVSRELFALVQVRMTENRKRTVRGASGGYLLTGLVTCTSCGQPYVGGGIGGRVRPNPNAPDGKLWFYKCSSGANEPPYRKQCPGHVGTVARHILDRSVLETIAHELSRPAVVSRITAEIDRALGARVGDAAAQLVEIRGAIANLERKRERLVALVADGTLIQEEAASQLASVRTDLTALKSREEASRFEEKRQHVDPAMREAVTRLALDFPRIARESSGPVLRELIRPWLARATFDKNTRQLTLDIRRVPAVGPFLVTNSPVLIGQEKRSAVVTRVVDLSTPQFVGKRDKRAANG